MASFKQLALCIFIFEIECWLVLCLDFYLFLHLQLQSWFHQSAAAENGVDFAQTFEIFTLKHKIHAGLWFYYIFGTKFPTLKQKQRNIINMCNVCIFGYIR